MRSPERAGTLAWKRRRIALFPAQVSEGQARTLASKERQCVANLDRGVYNSRVCFDLLDDVVADSGSRSRARVSMYDVGRWEPPGAEFPPGHKALERYLNVRAVRRAIHVTHSAAFLECTDPPYDALSSRDGVGVSAELAAVLDDPRRTVRVLFFNGVRDLVCNHLRTETVLEKLAWAGASMGTMWPLSSTARYVSWP